MVESGDRYIPEAAPPIAHDADVAIRAVDRLREALKEGDVNKAAYAAAQVGFTYCKMLARPFEKASMEGRKLVQSRKKGGATTAKTTADEKRLIVAARDSLMKSSDRTNAWAAEKIAAQLRTGTFPGIDRAIDYAPKYVANLRAAR